MANFKLSGQRKSIEGIINCSAGANWRTAKSPPDQYSEFDVSVREYGDFSRNKSYRFHTIRMNRAEAEEVVAYLRHALDKKI